MFFLIFLISALFVRKFMRNVNTNIGILIFDIVIVFVKMWILEFSRNLQ